MLTQSLRILSSLAKMTNYRFYKPSCFSHASLAKRSDAAIYPTPCKTKQILRFIIFANEGKSVYKSLQKAKLSHAQSICHLSNYRIYTRFYNDMRFLFCLSKSKSQNLPCYVKAKPMKHCTLRYFLLWLYVKICAKQPSFIESATKKRALESIAQILSFAFIYIHSRILLTSFASKHFIGAFLGFLERITFSKP